MPKCKHCKTNIPKDKGVMVKLKIFCNWDCVNSFISNNKDDLVTKGNELKRKEQKKADTKRKKELMSRPTWYKKLQKVTNQYHRDVLYAGKPCYTCGKPRGIEQTDWGHFIAVGSGGGDRRRFMPDNGRPQCSHCNNHNSGMRAEFRENLIQEKGLEWVQWLECESNHPELKELFPHWIDIENEISKYRKLIREAGFKPCI